MGLTVNQRLGRFDSFVRCQRSERCTVEFRVRFVALQAIEVGSSPTRCTNSLRAGAATETPAKRLNVGSNPTAVSKQMPRLGIFLPSLGILFGRKTPSFSTDYS